MVNIELQSHGNENKQKRALFKAWLERDSEASWSRLVEALGRVSSSLRERVMEDLEDQQLSLVSSPVSKGPTLLFL